MLLDSKPMFKLQLLRSPIYLRNPHAKTKHEENEKIEFYMQKNSIFSIWREYFSFFAFFIFHFREYGKFVITFFWFSLFVVLNCIVFDFFYITYFVSPSTCIRKKSAVEKSESAFIKQLIKRELLTLLLVLCVVGKW